MDLINLNDPDRHDFNSPRFDSGEPFDIAEKHRVLALRSREHLEGAKRAFNQQKEATGIAVQESEAAKLYLQQLQGGWGAPLVHVGPATLYEFWLEIPGYSGAVRGFSASTSQTGQIQHVSHVTSKTTSGAGCAALGCLAAGPVGAVAGATMGKKNDVKTDVQVIDDRRFEIQVIGPGVAWSYVGNYTIEDSVRSFRDLLLARSTNTDDPKMLAIGQAEVVAVKDRSMDLSYMRLGEADEFLQSATASFELAWSDYEDVRLSVFDDVIARWKRSSAIVKAASIVFGPVLTISWITSIIVAAILKTPSSPDVIVVATLVGVIQLASFILLGLYYRVEVRLLKTLPSESSALQPVYNFLNKALQRRMNH